MLVSLHVVDSWKSLEEQLVLLSTEPSFQPKNYVPNQPWLSSYVTCSKCWPVIEHQACIRVCDSIQEQSPVLSEHTTTGYKYWTTSSFLTAKRTNQIIFLSCVAVHVGCVHGGHKSTWVVVIQVLSTLLFQTTSLTKTEMGRGHLSVRKGQTESSNHLPFSTSLMLGLEEHFK